MNGMFARYSDCQMRTVLSKEQETKTATSLEDFMSMALMFWEWPVSFLITFWSWMKGTDVECRMWMCWIFSWSRCVLFEEGGVEFHEAEVCVGGCLDIPHQNFIILRCGIHIPTTEAPTGTRRRPGMGENIMLSDITLLPQLELTLNCHWADIKLTLCWHWAPPYHLSLEAP